MQETQTYNTSLWELYYIINNEFEPHVSLRDMMYALFNEFDEEAGPHNSTILREVKFEDFATKVIDLIISKHIAFKSDPWVLEMRAKAEAGRNA